MAIQVRRGYEADFDASKMLPGEWAVSLDTKYVRMCFAPGVVLRMATYEAFETDKAQIQAILAECKTIQSAMQRIQSEVNSKAALTIEYSNSAKESADRAYNEAERAKTYANNAAAVTGVQIATQERAGLIKGGDNYVAEDGTLQLITETTETAMPNSCEGRLLFKEIRGKTEQGANPTPTNPQEIRSVEISGIKTHGEQLLNYNVFKTIGTMNGTSVFENNGVTITAINRDAYTFYNANDIPEELKIPVSEGEEITLSWELDSDAVGNVYIFENGNPQINVPMSANNLKLTHKVGSGTYFVTVRFGVTNAGDTISYKNIMLNKGGEALPYEPYTESVVTFSKPIELNKIGDVQDEIENNVTKRKYKKVILDGSSDEEWTLATGVEQPSTFYCEISDAKRSATTQNALCNAYTFVDTIQTQLNNNECTMYHDLYNNYPDSNWIYLRDTSCANVSELRAKLQANPITVIYELATPITEELPTADQVALNSLKTFEGITYLEFDSPLQPEFVAEYSTSKVGGKTLEALAIARNNEIRISALETSAVNNI